ANLADALLERGVAALRVNTRGHDAVSIAHTRDGGRRLGAAFEIVDACRADLAAWIDHAVKLGYPRIGVLGHSLGAVKAIYAMEAEPHDAVARVLAVSPPRLSHAWFLESERGEEFSRTCAEAQRLVESGGEQSLMDVAFPLPMLITAEGYLEKY